MNRMERHFDYVDYDHNDPIAWSERNRMIKDITTGQIQLIKYKMHPFLVEPMRYSSQDRSHAIWIKGRQGGLSEACITLGHHKCFIRPNTSVIHTLTDYEQMKKFSRTKLTPIYNLCPAFMKMLISDEPDSKNKKKTSISRAINITMKQFKNYSAYMLTYLKDDSAAKSQDFTGIQGDIIYIDERGYSPENVIIPLMQCASASPVKILLEWGTPRLQFSKFHDLYLMSDQRNWIVICHECKTENQLIDFNDWTTWDSHIFSNPNDGKHFFGCEKCGMELDRLQGYWKPLNPTGEIRGYYFPQTIFSWITADELLFNFKTWTGAQRKDFIRECLGIPYSGEDVPIRMEWLEGCLDPTYSWGELDSDYHLFGQDWGNISYYNDSVPDDGKIKVNWMDTFTDTDTNKHTEGVEDIWHKWVSFMAVLDSGYAKHPNQQLMPKYPGKVWSCHYGLGDTKKIIAWNSESGKGDDKVNWHVTINHASLVEEVAFSFRDKLWRFPGKTEVDRQRSHEIFKNMMKVEKVVEEKDTGLKTKYKVTQAHYFMTCLYVYLAYLRGGTGEVGIETKTVYGDDDTIAEFDEHGMDELGISDDDFTEFDNIGGGF